jgi:hypothetical protein
LGLFRCPEMGSRVNFGTNRKAACESLGDWCTWCFPDVSFTYVDAFQIGAISGVSTTLGGRIHSAGTPQATHKLASGKEECGAGRMCSVVNGNYATYGWVELLKLVALSLGSLVLHLSYPCTSKVCTSSLNYQTSVSPGLHCE